MSNAYRISLSIDTFSSARATSNLQTPSTTPITAKADIFS